MLFSIITGLEREREREKETSAYQIRISLIQKAITLLKSSVNNKQCC